MGPIRNFLSEASLAISKENGLVLSRLLSLLPEVSSCNDPNAMCAEIKQVFISSSLS